MSAPQDDLPLWLRDIDATLPVTSSYVLHGNLRDMFMVPTARGVRHLGLYQAIWEVLGARGYRALLVHTPVGVSVVSADAADQRKLLGELSLAPHAALGPEQLGRLVQQVLLTESRLGLMVDYLSQWQPPGQPPSDANHQFQQQALVAIHQAVPGRIGERATPVFNPLLWVVDRPADLPTWLVGGCDTIRQISVPRPDISERLQFARRKAPALTGEDSTGDITAFAEISEGMTLRAMDEVVHLARDRALPWARIKDAVRVFRVGLTENPWSKPELRERIANGQTELADAVRGQDRAVRQTLDILVRSTTGMTGAQRRGGSGGPRGILFFAGPTGVGKTEMAKAVTRLVFGDERAYIRFDMSEFAAEHNEARLIGSPPGYVGHGHGGELTNAVRQKPFALVLFDEIEKAHPLILDKFLQILSDGRLTDGSGDTVHFEETVIVFTSNLGVEPPTDPHNLPQGAAFASGVLTAVRDDFTHRIKRPELLGRIGEDNIVVFDYINPATAEVLADRFINNTLSHAHETSGVTVDLPDPVRRQLVAHAVADRTLGGRGINNAIETAVVNPLARVLFARPESATHITITGWQGADEGNPTFSWQ